MTDDRGPVVEVCKDNALSTVGADGVPLEAEALHLAVLAVTDVCLEDGAPIAEGVALANGWAYSYATQKPLNQLTCIYQRVPSTSWNSCGVRTFTTSGSTSTTSFCPAAASAWEVRANVFVNGVKRGTDVAGVYAP